MKAPSQGRASVVEGKEEITNGEKCKSSGGGEADLEGAPQAQPSPLWGRVLPPETGNRPRPPGTILTFPPSLKGLLFTHVLLLPMSAAQQAPPGGTLETRGLLVTAAALSPTHPAVPLAPATLNGPARATFLQVSNRLCTMYIKKKQTQTSAKIST